MFLKIKSLLNPQEIRGSWPSAASCTSSTGAHRTLPM